MALYFPCCLKCFLHLGKDSSLHYKCICYTTDTVCVLSQDTNFGKFIQRGSLRGFAEVLLA